MGSGISKACCLTTGKEKKGNKTITKADKLPMLKTKYQISKEDIHKIYTLRSKIGKGYFSTVKWGYKTIEGEKGPKYAIKIIQKSKVDESLYNDFLNELIILTSLDHPNVIKLYEVYEDNLNYFLVMEYLSGGDIFQRIERDKKINESFIAEILYKVISAINYCHSIGICHRDIKPENILFTDKTPKADVKIIDFGLSKKFNSENDELMHSFLGTPYFVAPEVIRKQYDLNCDMWSIGATAFMLFAGYPPFPDKKREIVLNKILKEEPVYDNQIWKKVSPITKEFVSLMLIKNPSKRITPQQALFHPFFKNIYDEVHHAKYLDLEILKNLSKFQNPFRFKKLVLGMLVNTLPREELQNLTQTFNAMDLDHEGFISMDELKNAFVKSNINLNDGEINKIIERIDSDKNGKLNYSEFLMAAINIKKGISHKNRLIKLFKTIDSENTGYIGVNNLKQFIMRGGREVEDVGEVLTMLEEVTKNHDTGISVDEFMKILDSD